MSTWTCVRCQHSYSSDDGDLKHGISPGTAWNDLPEDWTCPDCHAPKFEFHQVSGSAHDGSGWTVQ